MKVSAALKSLSILAALAVSSFATARTQSFAFTECLSGCSGEITSVASLSITSITNGLSFRLTNTAPSGSFISDFYTSGPLGIASGFAGQSVSDYSYSPGINENVVTSGNGYNYNFSYPTAANKDRFVSGDTTTWMITGQNLLPEIFFNPLRMMVHVQGLTEGESIKIGAVSMVSAVPEPEGYAMLVAGLGLMGLVARRRKDTRFHFD